MSEKSRKELLAEIKHLQAEQEAYERENAELRKQLEETQERPFDLEYFVQQAAGDDVAIEITDYIKSLERNKRRLSWENAKLEQKLAEANAELNSVETVNKSMQKSMIEQKKVLNRYLEKSKLQNATIERMRAALEEIQEHMNIWEKHWTGSSCVEIRRDKLRNILLKALSTTPSQAVERQKRIVKLARELIRLWNELGNIRSGDEYLVVKKNFSDVMTVFAAAVKEAE